MRNIWFWIHLAVFILVSLVAYYHNLGYLYYGGDGAYALHIVSHQAKWLPMDAGFSADYLQGFGDMFFQVNTRLNPAYFIPLILLGPDVTTVAFQLMSYTLFSVQLFLCTYILARALSVEFIPSILAAWVTPLLIMPYSAHGKLYMITSLVPHYVTPICILLLMFSAFARLGVQHSTVLKSYIDYILIAALLILVLLLCIISPTSCILWAPAAFIGMTGLLLSSYNKHEVVLKIAGMAAMLLPFVCTGMIPFIYGSLSYSVAHLLPDKLTSATYAWNAVSAYYFSDYGYYLIIISVLGMVFAFFSANRCLRYFSVASIVFMAAFFSMGALVMHKTEWHAPFPIYFEAFIWPVYVIYACYFITIAAAFIIKLISFLLPDKISQLFHPLIVMVCIVASLVFTLLEPVTPRPSPLPYIDERMISLLHHKIGITPGLPYRGRAATVLLSDRTTPVSWQNLIVINQFRYEKNGNDFYWAGLWYAAIPTLFIYTPSMSPAFFHAAIKLVGFESDEQVRNVVVLRRADYHNLALLGINYVISDRMLPAPFKLELKDKLDKNDLLYLYKLPDANVSGFSPTRLIMSNSLKKALELISNKNFNPSTTVVSEEDVLKNYKLVPAKNISILTLQGKLHISADSQGDSLLVLPFEYSQCLTVLPQNSTVKLVRVNAIQVGVLFSKSVSIDLAYQYSPFKNSMCRINDGKWLKQQLLNA